jgi:hypothetical protein
VSGFVFSLKKWEGTFGKEGAITPCEGKEHVLLEEESSQPSCHADVHPVSAKQI